MDVVTLLLLLLPPQHLLNACLIILKVNSIDEELSSIEDPEIQKYHLPHPKR